MIKVNLDSTGKRATSVTYVDAQGEEFEQPAELVILSRLSSCTTCICCCCRASASRTIPSTGKGVVGKNYAYQITLERRCLLRRQDPQSVHRRRRARHDRRRLQRRQFRPYGARLHRRRLHRRCWNTNGRPIETASDARGHAEMGRQVEEGGGENYLTSMTRRDARRGDEPPRQLPRPRSRPIATSTAGR